MAIRIARKTVHLEGHCTVEEALPLLEALRKPGPHKVVLTKCLGLHDHDPGDRHAERQGQARRRPLAEAGAHRD
ncbi:hypothetical protein FV228_29440, partial [Methylobacterium sp. WL18]|uniref:hypothetical protein n=1 Tax=Methylobacterium sp. WL18 TaxID=2603897 RepID=UPI0011D4CCEF